MKIGSTKKKLTHIAVWKNACTLEPANAQDSFTDRLDQEEANAHDYVENWLYQEKQCT
jgi:hypothetical protein